MAGPATRVTWPPRLIGARFEAPRPFQGKAYLPLGSLTVLLGANGAGKTTTLRVLSANLPSLAASSVDAEGQDDRGTCTFFVHVTDEQLEILIEEGAALSPGGQQRPVRWEGPQWPGEAVYALDRTKSAQSVTSAWRDTLVAHTDPDAADDWRLLLKELEQSRIVEVERRPGDSEYSLAWCLDADDALAPSVRDALDRFGFRLPDAQSIQSAPMAHSIRHPPIAVAPLPTTARTMLPTAVSVPRDPDDVRRELRDAVVDLLVHARWAELDCWARERGLSATDAQERRGTKAWLADPDSNSTTINPQARGLCRLASRLATALAPAFISETQNIEVQIEPLHRWERGGPRLELIMRSGRLQASYSLGRAADGHKVWIQLSLLETVAIVRRFLHVLEGLLKRAMACQGTDRTVRRERNPDWLSYTAALELLDRLSGEDDVPDDVVRQFLGLRNVGHRLYLIDEPEQHLHPRLQRSAARWLADAGTDGASQCVVATHSPHYLRVPGDVSFAYLQQLSGEQGIPRTVIGQLAPELLAASDDIARQMGFDRGELLSSVSLVLFVEGEADRRFLSAFCGRQLHHAGIALVPIHGAVAAHKKGIVDSETVLIWTAAKLAVLLDNLTSNEWTALEADPDHCRDQARKGTKTEIKAMAEILLRAHAVGRDIAAVGIPVPDIFDLLDEQLLRERFPKFPSHSAARDEWERACAKQQINWKAFYRDRYDLSVEPQLFEEIGRAMAARSVRPPDVGDLVAHLQELANLP